jgi:predicted RNA-binding protein associated with RNAse of E/G family
MATVHPPKISTFDVPGMVNIDTKGCVRPVDVYTETEFGLYMSRPIVSRPTAHWIETWLLPELGIAVSDWWWNPGHERDQDFYLDIASITRDGPRWVLVDHYLDIVVLQRRSTQVIDVDEFTAALSAGLIDPAGAEAAMHATIRAVAGLAAHGNDLDAWLAELGIRLTWRQRDDRC